MKPSVVIQHLEVHLDVTGEDEDAAFGRLFERWIRRWDQAKCDAVARRRLAEAERRLTPDGSEDD